MTLKEKLNKAYEKDLSVACEASAVGETLGNNPTYLEEVHGITKSDLIRLERKALALKARYVTPCGEHRVRWIIFKGALV